MIYLPTDLTDLGSDGQLISFEVLLEWAATTGPREHTRGSPPLIGLNITKVEVKRIVVFPLAVHHHLFQ